MDNPNTVRGLYYSMKWQAPDNQPGSIWFYQTAATGEWDHNGMNVGGDQNTVDQNCGHAHSTAQPPTVNTHAADDPALVKPEKYATPIALSTNELQQLDGE